MQIAIPLKTTSSGGSAAAYDTVVDATYSVYNAALKDYPVTNAFTDGADTSVTKWGLQSTNRTTQNNIFKGHLSHTTAAGTSALSLKSITYPFTRTISSLDSGNVQTMFYQNGLPTVKFNTTNKNISNVYVGGYATAIGGSTRNKNIFIASSGGNRFAVQADSSGNVYTYSLNANNAVTGLAQTLAISGRRAWVIAAKNQYVWVVTMHFTGNTNTDAYRIYGRLYSVSSTGVLTLVGSEVSILSLNQGNGAGSSSFSSAVGSYVINNTAHLIVDIVGGSSYSTKHQGYHTVDLATVSAFTFTQRQITTADTSVASGDLGYNGFGPSSSNRYTEIVTGFNGTYCLYVTNLGTAATPDVYRVSTGATFADSTVNYFATFDYMCRLKASTTLLSTANSNWYCDTSSTFKVLGTVAHSGTFTNLYQSLVFMYEMTGTNQMDDVGAFKDMPFPCAALPAGEADFTLKLNGSAYLTKNYANTINFNTSSNFNWTITRVAVNATKLNFELAFANNGAVDTKIGFSLNGGTYAAPTGNYELSTINVCLA